MPETSTNQEAHSEIGSEGAVDQPRLVVPLPCPFCGGVPEITKHYKYDMHSLMHRCKLVGVIHFDFGRVSSHVERWNTRHNSQAHGRDSVP